MKYLSGGRETTAFAVAESYAATRQPDEKFRGDAADRSVAAEPAGARRVPYNPAVARRRCRWYQRKRTISSSMRGGSASTRTREEGESSQATPTSTIR